MKKGIEVELYSDNQQDIDELENIVRDFVKEKMSGQDITSFKIQRIGSFTF